MTWKKAAIVTAGALLGDFIGVTLRAGLRADGYPWTGALVRFGSVVTGIYLAGKIGG